MFLGDKIEVRLRAGEASLIAYFPNSLRLGQGDSIRIHIPPDRVVALRA